MAIFDDPQSDPGFPAVTGSADGTNSDARFYEPSGVAVDSGGNLFVADTVNCTIRKITPIGTNWVVTTIAGRAEESGRADGMNSTALFAGPCGIAVDGADNLYVADTYNNSIRKVTPVGTNWMVTTLAGLGSFDGDTFPGSADGTGSVARFNEPQSLALDSAGNIFVADYVNGTIRKVTQAGVVTTLAGLALSYGSTNATGSAARFRFPYGIVVDSAGNLYVTDSNNQDIRKGGAALSITMQPQGQTLPVGTNFTLGVSVTGPLPLSYQWFFNGTNLPAATNATLAFPSIQLTNTGNYQVIVTNIYGAVTSAVAVLTVLLPPMHHRAAAELSGRHPWQQCQF